MSNYELKMKIYIHPNIKEGTIYKTKTINTDIEFIYLNEEDFKRMKTCLNEHLSLKEGDNI